MTRIIQRNPAVTLPTAARGEGVYLYDTQGKQYFDASGGAAVSCLGHGHPAILAAMRKQLDSLAFAHTSFFTTAAAEALAEKLVSQAPDNLTHAYFVCDGSEAVEAALKMARQYYLDIGQPDRQYVVARRQSYHGNTLGALSVTGRLWNRKPFEPLLFQATHVSPCYAYRDQLPGETAETYGLRLAKELDDTFTQLGTGKVIAFIAETVGGATSGCIPPVQGYFKAVREVCDKHGVLLILDEVMCGMGRTGTLHACTQEGVSPDLMTMAKGLSGGYHPIGAVLVHGKIARAFEAGTGSFQHGHTYLAHAMGAATALAVLETFERDNLLANVQHQGRRLQAQLHERLATDPVAGKHVGDIRGRGLFWGIELVADKASKAPLPASFKFNAKVKAAAMREGLCCYPMGGTVDGKVGDHILLAPPYICADADIDELVTRLIRGVAAATAALPASV
jgi:adenosylmethionine-8-amino-7-oxononanoate aminotransferase